MRCLADEPAENVPEFSDLSENEMAECRMLKNGEASFDLLCTTLNIDPGRLSSVLTKLELKLIVAQDSNKCYRLNKKGSVL